MSNMASDAPNRHRRKSSRASRRIVTKNANCRDDKDDIADIKILNLTTKCPVGRICRILRIKWFNVSQALSLETCDLQLYSHPFA
jgi:hypothetical protein